MGWYPKKGGARMMLAFLIVDDELWISKTLAQWLEKAFEGADVRLARTNREALTILESFAPNLIITDLHHPGGDGKELRAHLRRNPKTRHMPVVLLSAAAASLPPDQTDFDVVLTQPCGYRVFMNSIKRPLNLDSDSGITTHAAEGAAWSHPRSSS